MGIRKEQVLVLVVLGIGALVWKGLAGSTVDIRSLSWKKQDYAPAAVRAGASPKAVEAAAARSELFTEPRETRTLPPRELPFPPHAPLSIGALPLDPGPDPGHSMALRVDGAPVAGVTLAAPAEGAAAPAAPETPEPATPTQDAAARRVILAQTYDQLFVQGLSAPYFGSVVDVEGMDRFDAEKLTDFEGRTVRFRPYSVQSGKVGDIKVYDKNELNKVAKIHLADSLRNEVTRHVREVPSDPNHLEERGALISWLLGKAREAAWVYDEALAQAVLYSKISNGDLEGLRWQLRVLQARGDLAGEFALLDGIQGPHRESAFRYEGLGLVKRKLGLLKDAEQDLRKAVELGRTDARPHAALADLLREQGRSREALQLVQRAEQTIGGLLDVADRMRVVRAIVSGHLAVGDLAAARAGLQLLPAERQMPYLAGCIAYAAGELPAALDAFRAASSGAEGSAALLGQGAVLLRQQLWQEAHDAFVAVADQAPLLRHRAWSGLALLHLRIGQLDQAQQWIDRALEANPQDAWSHYLRGRILRQVGQLGAAQEAIGASLRLQDDYVYAIAEMSALQAARAEELHGEDQAAALLHAVHYGERAVALADVPSVELFERQGLLQFAAGDPVDAEAAFARARDLAPTDPEKLFAKGAIAVVEYGRGFVDDATVALQRFSELPKDDPMRKWAETTLAAIDDHAQKEMLEDRFERGEIGQIWQKERDGNFVPDVHDNKLVFRGKFSRAGQGEIWAERVGAVLHGKNFLAVGITMTLGKDHPRGDGFAGLRIETQRGSQGQTDFQVQVGVREGKPHLRIAEQRDEPFAQNLEIEGFDPTAPQRLELRVVPRGEAQARNFTLQVRWNDRVVHTRDLKALSGSTAAELHTVMFAAGSKGSDVDVTFDDYRLERRKER